MTEIFGYKSSLLLSALAGAATYWWIRHRTGQDSADLAPAAAFAGPGAQVGSFAQVRDSGPENMRDGEQHDWDDVDEAADQSFPASDPPGTY